jgi:hypothetical protein
MRNWEYFAGLARMAAGGLAWAWPVTAVLVLLVVGVAVWSRRELNALFRLRALWQLLPLGVPVAVLALGTLYACGNCSPSSLGQGQRHVWAMRAADALLVAQLLGATMLVKLGSPLRALAASLQLFLVWCSFWAGFMAGMSMSEDWL